MQPSSLDKAFANLEKAEDTSKALWNPDAEVSTDETFQNDIRDTAKTLLSSIKQSAGGPYALEATDLAKLTKSVCDLQQTFFGKDEKAAGTVIMTNQLSLFKDML